MSKKNNIYPLKTYKFANNTFPKIPLRFWGRKRWVSSENLVQSKGWNAASIIRDLSIEIKGGGGGQPFFATAGGSDVRGLKKVIIKAKEIFNDLKSICNCAYDEKDSIGKRYRRNDALGTPFCITIDHDTLNDNAVTVRERDSMNQYRIPINELSKHISEKTSMKSLF